MYTTGVRAFVDHSAWASPTSLAILEVFELILTSRSPQTPPYGLETMSEHLRMIFYRFGCICGALAPIGGRRILKIDENPLIRPVPLLYKLQWVSDSRLVRNDDFPK